MNPGDTVLFSPDRDTVGVGNAEDILQSDGAGGFSLFFDGSSLGLSGANIDAFDLVSATEILMSFSRTVFLTGIGLVDDSDIVQFTATSLGENATTGSFSMVLDGSTIGLTRAGEDIDALTQMPDETLLFSTKSTANTTNGLQAENEDLMQYDPDNGNLSLYFDGSDVGLDERREDIDAISFVNNQLLLSTAGGFTVDGLSGQDEDIFSFTATATGINTQGSFDPTLCFDGSTLGFNGDIAALDIVAMLDAVDDTFSIAENTVLNGNLFADNGSGVDTGNSFTVTATSSTTNGALLVNADGTFSYTPGNNFVGSDSFMYSISDGTNTDIATVNITVTAGLNTAPNITSDGGGAIATINVAENTTAVTNVETNDDSDTEGSGLTYSFSTIGGGGADNGSFSLDANTGVLAFVTAPDFETPGSVDNDNQYLVQVTVTDSGNLTDTQDIAVNVTDVATENNAAPVVNNVTYNMLGNSILEIAGAEFPGNELASITSNISLLSGVTDADSAAPTIVQGTFATTGGGLATVFANGSFFYQPEAGDVNITDSFTFTVDDGDGNQVMATATINVGSETFYVDDDGNAGGDGSPTNPFNTLAAAQAVADIGDVIYLAAGTYNENLVLEQNQSLIGQGADFALAMDELLDGDAGTRPVINGTLSGTNVGTATVSGVTVNSGTATALDLTFTAGTADIDVVDTIFNGANADGILDVDVSSNANVRIDITNSTFNPGTTASKGIALNAGDSSQLDFNIIENTVTGNSASGDAIEVEVSGTATAEGRINTNTITANDSIGVNIDLDNGSPVGIFEINSNIIDVNTDVAGIFLEIPQGTGDFTIGNNDIDIDTTVIFGGITGDVGLGGGTAAASYNIFNNDVNQVGGSGDAYGILQNNSGTSTLDGFITDILTTLNNNSNTVGGAALTVGQAFEQGTHSAGTTEAVDITEA